MNVAAPIARGPASRARAHETQADPHARHAHGPSDAGEAAGQAKLPSEAKRPSEGKRPSEARRRSADRVELSREGKASALRTAAPDPEEMRVIADLKARDREVRAHEAAHKAASGQYAGAVHLDFTTGPDGQQYAVGGEVSIDTSPVAGDPEATVEKMRTIQAAAMAPANPSAGRSGGRGQSGENGHGCPYGGRPYGQRRVQGRGVARRGRFAGAGGSRSIVAILHVGQRRGGPDLEPAGVNRIPPSRLAYRSRTVALTVPPFSAEYVTVISPLPRTRYSIVLVVRPACPLRTMIRSSSF